MTPAYIGRFGNILFEMNRRVTSCRRTYLIRFVCICTVFEGMAFPRDDGDCRGRGKGYFELCESERFPPVLNSKPAAIALL